MLNLFPVTDVALEGFRLTRENPRAVAVWASIRAVYALTVLLIVNRIAGDDMTAFINAVRTVRNLSELSGKAAPLANIFLFLSPLDLAVQAVLSAACFRTVLGPRAPSRFQLTVGADELRLFALNLIALLAFILSVSVATILGDVVATATAGPVGSLVQTVYTTGVIFAFLYVGLRLSLTPALTFAHRRFAFRESWTATEGRYTPLGGAYLMSGALAVLVYVLGMVIGASTEAFDRAAASDWASLGALITAAWMAGVWELIAVIVTAPGAVASRLLATRAVDRA